MTSLVHMTIFFCFLSVAISMNEGLFLKPVLLLVYFVFLCMDVSIYERRLLILIQLEEAIRVRDELKAEIEKSINEEYRKGYRFN